MQCLEPEAAGLHNAWTNIALHPQMLIDALVSLRGGSHALTINRLHHARERSRKSAGFVDGDRMPEHLARHGSMFLQIEAAHDDTRKRGRQPLFDRLSRREILALLDELAPTFESQGVSLAPVAAVNAGWSVAIAFYTALVCSMRSMPTASRPPSSHE